MSEDKNRIYVCQLVSAVDVLPKLSTTGTCDMCHEPIFMMLNAPDHMPKVCGLCAAKIIQDDLEQDPDSSFTILPGSAARRTH